MYLTKILTWRGVLFLAISACVLMTIGFAVQQPHAPMTAPAQLDFEFFKTQVQPIFLAKRPGHARCVSCHITSTPMRLQPLSPGSGAWDEEQSRQNFDVVRQRVIPGSLQSKLLTHLLATEAEANHGVAAAPDGSRIYFSDEALETLDIVDARTLQVTKRVALSGRPNNISISRDGRRVYVAIVQAPGAVDVIDTASQERVKSIPAKGGVHNTYVTPDGKYVIAGSIVGKIMTVIDAQTEQPVWSLEFDLGVRPMAFEQNADGSTKRIFVQLTEFHGFAAVDFQTRKEVTRITLPPLPPGKVDNKEGGNISHGMAVTADGKTLVVTSRQNSALYAYSLPDLKLLGGADVGLAPDWVTLTPDSKTAYVANAGSNSVSVIDLKSLKEVARIPVGQVPKRNTTALLQVQ